MSVADWSVKESSSAVRVLGEMYFRPGWLARWVAGERRIAALPVVIRDRN